MRGGKNITLFLSTLPVPKSNRYIRRKDGHIFRSPRVLKWEAHAVWEIQKQYRGEAIEIPISVEVFFFLPDRRKRDIDNMLKSLWDVLEKAQVVKNDNLIFETRTVKIFDGEIHGTVIVIKPYKERKTTFERMKNKLKGFKDNL